MHAQPAQLAFATDRPASQEPVFIRGTPGALHTQEPLVALPYVLHPASNEVEVGGEVLRLTTKEFDLAYFLFRRRGEPVSRRELGERVWGHGPQIESRTLDAHVSRLRRKLTIRPDNGWRLVAVYGFGYSLQPARVA